MANSRSAIFDIPVSPDPMREHQGHRSRIARFSVGIIWSSRIACTESPKSLSEGRFHLSGCRIRRESGL